MYLHIVMMAFNDAMNPFLRQCIEQCFNTIRNDSKGVVRFELLDNQSHTSTHYTHALLSIFTSKQALDTYRTGAAHAQMMKTLTPHIAQIEVLDSVLTEDWD